MRSKFAVAAVGVVLLGLLSGCPSKSSPESARVSSAISGSPSAGSRGRTTTVTITYSTGATKRSRAAATTLRCPAGHCSVMQVPHSKPGIWILEVDRKLSCGPNPRQDVVASARGDYAHPRHACQALLDYVKLVRKKHHRRVCNCPEMRVPLARAQGVIRGRHMVIPLEFCMACGLERRAARDLSILIPRVPMLVKGSG